MTTLSEPTVSAIVNALLKSYKSACELAAYWDARIQITPAFPDAAAYQRVAHQAVEQNESAIKEVREKFAPWIRNLDQCKQLFEAKTSNHLTQENP